MHDPTEIVHTVLNHTAFRYLQGDRRLFCLTCARHWPADRYPTLEVYDHIQTHPEPIEVSDPL